MSYSAVAEVWTALHSDPMVKGLYHPQRSVFDVARTPTGN